MSAHIVKPIDNIKFRNIIAVFPENMTIAAYVSVFCDYAFSELTNIRMNAITLLLQSIRPCRMNSHHTIQSRTLTYTQLELKTSL